MKKTRTVVTLFVTFVLLMALLVQGAYAAETISVAFWDQGDDARVQFENVINAFNRSQSKYRAVPDPIPGAIWAVLLARAAGGNPPDLCWFMGANINQFVEMNMLLDLTPYIQRDNYNLDDFFPPFLNCFKFDGKVYAIPLEADVRLVGYNKDMFDAAGVEYPSEDWTWDDMLALARKLVIRDGSGKAVQWGFNGFFGYFAHSASFLPITWSNGGELFNRQDYPTVCLATSKEVVDAITFVRDLRFKYKVEVMPGEPAGLDSSENFYTGKAAMCFVGVGTERMIQKAGSRFNWDFQIYPRGSKTRSANAGAVGYAIFKGSKNPDGAWEFIKFLMSEEGQLAYAIPGTKPLLSVKRSQMEKIVAQNRNSGRNIEAILKTMSFGRAYGYRVKPDVNWDSQWNPVIVRVYSGQIDVMPAMKQVKPILDAMLRKAHR